jgi:hypothetical protein
MYNQEALNVKKQEDINKTKGREEHPGLNWYRSK